MHENNHANAVTYDVIVSAARSAQGRLLAISAAEADSDRNVYVKHADGGDLEQWERRAARPNGRFAIINKRRPDKCIARKDARNGSPLILIDVSEIPKNDFCIWGNEGDPMGNHRIYSGVDSEQKINIPGDGPYRDGQPLITWEASRGAANEMWRQLNGAFNLAAGLDATAANTLSNAVYSGVYPRVFKGSIPVGRLNLKSVAYDIKSAPVFKLKSTGASPRMLELYREALCMNPSAEQLENFTLESTKATFAGDFTSVSFTLEFADQTTLGPVYGSVQTTAVAEARIDHSIKLRLLDGFIQIDGLPGHLLENLNAAFTPLLLAYLNKNVLEAITVPEIDLKGVSFSMPELVTQSNTLLAFSAKQPSPVLIPPPSSWPSGVAFVAADKEALDAVATAALREVEFHDSWSWSCRIGLCDFQTTARYWLNFGSASFTLVPGTRDRLSGRIGFSGGASFNATCGALSPTFSATIEGSADVSAELVVRGEKVYAIFDSLRNINVSVSISGLLWPISQIIDLLVKAFSPTIAGAVTRALHGESFELYTIPQINFSIAGTPFSVKLKNLQLCTIAGPAGVPLLTVTGLADVRSPSYKLTPAPEAAGLNQALGAVVIEEVAVEV